MAKQRRARNDSRAAAARPAPSQAAEHASPLPAQTHVRKLNKRVKFLQRVQESALAARAAVFKRKRAGKGATLGSLASLGDALPELHASSPSAHAKPHFLATRGRKVVRAATRIKLCAAETSRFAAVLANPQFQADPVAAVCNHVLAQMPPREEGMGQGGGRSKARPQGKGGKAAATRTTRK